MFLKHSFWLILFFVISFILPKSSCAQENITITTYYPAPFGVYEELRSRRMAIGNNYINGAQFCWAPGVCANQINANTDLVVEGRVGIGTTDSWQPLRISSNADEFLGQLLVDGQNNNDAVIGLATTTPNNDAAFFLDRTDLDKLKIALGNTDRKVNRNASTRMTIDQAGNVGIGTTAPQARLDVVGDTLVRGSEIIQGNLTVAGTANIRGLVAGGFSIGDFGCEDHNDYTGWCSCPAGFTAHFISAIWESGPWWDAIFICIRS